MISSTTQVAFLAFSHSQSIVRSTAASENVQLVRPARSNRASVYMQLLYQWKLIDPGESLALRVTCAVDVVNLSSSWVNYSELRNVLLLASNVGIEERRDV